MLENGKEINFIYLFECCFIIHAIIVRRYIHTCFKLLLSTIFKFNNMFHEIKIWSCLHPEKEIFESKTYVNETNPVYV